MPMQAVQQAMKAEYNDSQMAAVTAGLDRSPVVLIQVSNCYVAQMEAAMHSLHSRAFAPTLCLPVSVKSRQNTGICCSLRARERASALRLTVSAVCGYLNTWKLHMACQRAACARLQGPPGTGKTRTILGLLSIILHASPANTAGLVKRAAAQPMPEYSRKDMDRLWRLASPWLAETANPRHACATQPMSLNVLGRPRTKAISEPYESTTAISALSGYELLWSCGVLSILGSSDRCHRFAKPKGFAWHSKLTNHWRRTGMQ